jgi:hypothetical protein
MRSRHVVGGLSIGEERMEWNGRGRDSSDAAEATLPSDMRAKRGRNGRTVENKPATQKIPFPPIDTSMYTDTTTSTS